MEGWRKRKISFALSCIPASSSPSVQTFLITHLLCKDLQWKENAAVKHYTQVSAPPLKLPSMLPWYLWIVNLFFQNTSLKCEGQSGLNFIVNIVIRTGEPSKWRLGIWKLRQSQGLSWNSFVALIGPDWWSNVLLVVFHSPFKSLETIDNKYYSIC